MNKEVERRRLYERLGKPRDILLRCYADTSSSFARDPIFPDVFPLKIVPKSDLNRMNRILKDGLAKIEGTQQGDSGYRARKTENGDGTVTIKVGPHGVHIRSNTLRRIKRAYLGDRENTGAFLRHVWHAAYRYSTLEMMDGMSASVPPSVYRNVHRLDPRAQECFASFFNHTLPSYYGLFPDIESTFGCVGNFFRMTNPPALMLCNPPFERFVMNAFFDHLLELMESRKCTAMVIIAAFDTSDRKRLNDLGVCKQKYPTNYNTDVYTSKLIDSPICRWAGLYCKDKFPYIDMYSEKKLNYTATLAVIMSSYQRPPVSPKSIASSLPPPDIVLKCHT
jgi:hypothetical protein